MIKIDNIIKYLSFLVGLTCTLEIFKVNLGVLSFYLHDIFFILLYVFFGTLFLTKKLSYKVNTDKKGLIVVITFFIFFISTINFWIPAIENVSNEYLLNSIKYSAKMIFLLIFIVIVLLAQNNSYKRIFAINFIEGFVAAIVLNTFYSLFQLVSFYFFKIDIHTIIFNSIGITEKSAGHELVTYLLRTPPILRLSGLHWDPAYFGITAIIGVIYFAYALKKTLKSKILLILIFISWVFTFSRTGYFALLMCLFCFVFFILILKLEEFKFIFKPILKLFSLLIFIAFIIVAIVNFKFPKTTKVITNFSSVRFSAKDKGSSRHLNYPIYGFQTISDNPLHFLFGYGSRNSGRALEEGNLNIPGLRPNIETDAFDVESDWAKTIMNFGILGIGAYFVWHFILVSALLYRCIKTGFNKYFVFGIIFTLVVFFAGLFYSYNDSRWVWLGYLSLIILIVLPYNRRINSQHIKSINETKI